MNKKKLPKAIRPTTAEALRAEAAAGAAISDKPAPARKPPMARTEAKPARQQAAEAPTVASVASRKTAPDTPETHSARRREIAEKLVERFSMWSGAAGFIPLPAIDLAAVGGLQIQMLRRISQLYNVPFSENLGKTLLGSLAGTLIPMTSVIGTTSMLKGVPVVGTVVGAIAMPALSVGATYAIGIAFIEHFASGGTLLDFHPADYRAFVKAQKQLRKSRLQAP